MTQSKYLYSKVEELENRRDGGTKERLNSNETIINPVAPCLASGIDNGMV